MLALCIQRAGGFIEQQHRRITQQCPGNGHTLLLAAGQAGAAFAQLAVVTLRQCGQEAIGFGGAGGGEDLLIAGVQASVADVLQRRAGKQHRMLWHQRHRLAQLLRVELAHVHPIQTDLALLRIIKTHHQGQQRALAGPGGADQGHRFTRADMQVDPLQHRRLRALRIMEVDVAQLQLAAHRGWQRHGRGRGMDGDRLCQQLADPAHAAGSALQLVPDFGQGADRAAADHRKHHELAQCTGAHLASGHCVGAVPQHQHDGAKNQHDGRGGDHGLGADPPPGGGQRRVQGLPVAALLVVFARIGLYRADRPQPFAGAAGGSGNRILAFTRGTLEPARAQDHRQDRQRNAEQAVGGQPWAGGEQADQCAGGGHRRAQCHRDGGGDHVAQQFRIGGQARDQFATAVVVMKAGIKRDQVRIQLVTQITYYAFAE